MSGTSERFAAILLLAVAVVVAGTLMAATAVAQDVRDDEGGCFDLGKGGPPNDGVPPGDGEADPDGHSINTEPWHFRDGAGDRFPMFARWIREFLLFAILFGPVAGLRRTPF